MEADEVLYLMGCEGVLIVIPTPGMIRLAGPQQAHKGGAQVSSRQIIAVENLPISRRLPNHKVRKNCASVWC
jgi:hypothetical protein